MSVTFHRGIEYSLVNFTVTCCWVLTRTIYMEYDWRQNLKIWSNKMTFLHLRESKRSLIRPQRRWCGDIHKIGRKNWIQTALNRGERFGKGVWKQVEQTKKRKTEYEEIFFHYCCLQILGSNFIWQHSMNMQR